MGAGGNCNVDCTLCHSMVLWDVDFGSMVPCGHRFPTSTPIRIADCAGLPPMRGLKGLRISFGSFPFRRTQFRS